MTSKGEELNLSEGAELNVPCPECNAGIAQYCQLWLHDKQEASTHLPFGSYHGARTRLLRARWGVGPDLLAIEARAYAATGGPWEAKRAPDKFDDDGKLIDAVTTNLWHVVAPPALGNKTSSHVCGMGGLSSKHEADAAFVAAAREDVPALITRVRELESEIRWLKGKAKAT
jgi:hypothetical protein